MERFVQYVVAGGLALVAGLWTTEFASPSSALWATGVALAALGAVALFAGVHRELDY